jgi:hypothetical protein
VKQFLKNKRRNHYRNGWLDVPDKYRYLKNNASMRDPTASRRSKALSAMAAAKDTQGPTLGRKGKEKAVKPMAIDDADESEEDSEELQDVEV